MKRSHDRTHLNSEAKEEQCNCRKISLCSVYLATVQEQLVAFAHMSIVLLKLQIPFCRNLGFLCSQRQLCGQETKPRIQKVSETTKPLIQGTNARCHCHHDAHGLRFAGPKISTHLRVVTMLEVPFIYADEVQSAEQCDVALKKIPCPMPNNTGKFTSWNPKWLFGCFILYSFIFAACHLVF